MTGTRIRLALATVAVVAGVTIITACAQPGAPAAGRPVSSAPVAAGDGPSASATMICQPEAEAEIAAALGVKTSQQPTPSWQDHVYTCRYEYPTGAMVLSVKELSDEATTTAYFTAAQHGLPTVTALKVLGQTAFAGPDGSLFVRKDFKVLHVDVGALPDHLGQFTRADAAFTVAAVIMSCWTGA